MTTRLEVHLLTVGSCRHCERVTIAGGSWRAVTFPALAALILHPTRGAVLFDTGYADHFEHATRPFPERFYRWLTPVRLPPEERLQAQLARHGLALGDVRTCVISHFHADHIAGLRDLPHARFVARREDHAALRSQGRVSGLRKGLLPALLPTDFEARVEYADDAPQRPLRGAWSAFGVGHDLFGDASLIGVTLPGHTRAQIGLVLRDADDRELLLCADAAWSKAAWRELRAPSWLTRSVMHDWKAYLATLRNLHALAQAHPELVILPSHCRESIAAYTASRSRR